ncbi:MAG TPA: YqaE/Pmp3 family membrane protein [Solirubrobacterales bacterium]|nr:YqaE/Pmp3 family membrane protein [Solirubrobacterales bacterium]
MSQQQITVASQTEREEVVKRLSAQRYRVMLKTEQETHLALPPMIPKDFPLIILLTLCGILPGILYYAWLVFGPRRTAVVTVAH